MKHFFVRGSVSEDKAVNNLTTRFASVPIRVIRGKNKNRGWTLINADKKQNKPWITRISQIERTVAGSIVETDSPLRHGGHGGFSPCPPCLRGEFLFVDYGKDDFARTVVRNERKPDNPKVFS